MDAVLRACAVFFFLLLLFRVSGKRTVSEVTTFDFVLLLIIAETSQQALLGQDYSITNSFVLIATLIALDIGLSLLKRRFPRLDYLLEDAPLVIVVDGQPLEDRMQRSRVDESDVLERMDQIKYAVLERHGGITVVPRRA